MGKLFILILLIYLSIAQVESQSYATQAAGYLLRIDGDAGWTKHIDITEGETVSLIVLSPVEGSGYLNEIYPDGRVSRSNHYFQRYDRLIFRADAVGQHILYYVIGDKASDAVVIDVSGTCAQPSVPQVGYGQLSYSRIARTGEQTYAVPPHADPIYLGSGFSSGPALIYYEPLGTHVMASQIGAIAPQYNSRHLFGKDFSLGTIDSNYPGTPFLTQFLADP